MERRSHISSIFCVIALLLAVTARSQEQWYTYYTNAQEAIAASDWSRAVPELEKALQRKPAPQFEAETYALQLVNYVPFYWLGVAYYNQGDFEKAEANFSKSLSWEKEKKTEFYSTLLKYQGILQRIQTASDSLAALQRSIAEAPGTAGDAAVLTASWNALADALAQDDFPRARGIVREIRSLSPENASSMIVERLMQQLAEGRQETADNRNTAAANRLFDEGLAQFLSGNYQSAYRSFSEVARTIEPRELPEVSWDFVYGTNMQHGFLLARRLLARQTGTKQIIMVTDGEPTAPAAAWPSWPAKTCSPASPASPSPTRLTSISPPKQ